MRLIINYKQSFKKIKIIIRGKCQQIKKALYNIITIKKMLKPAVTPYDRNSRLGLKMVTVNPCNQFIIQTLLRWKVNVQKQGLNQFYTYNLAVQSVRKYPLPILCYQQVKSMEGFGKFFCTSVSKLIRSHYRRGRLPNIQEKQQIDKQHQLFLRRQMKKLKTMNHKYGIKTQQDQQGDAQDIQSQKYSQFNDNFQSQVPQGSDQQQGSIYDDQSDISDSVSCRSNKSYRPKPGTQSFNILRAMSHCLQNSKQKQKICISRGQINSQFYQWKMDKVRNWSKVLDNLKDSGYIKLDPKDDYLLLFTTKGKDYIQDMIQSSIDKQTHKFNHVWVLKKQLVQNTDSLTDKLTMLINIKGLFKQQDLFLNQILQSNHCKIKQSQYQLGSFIWMLDQKILDCVLFRFKVQGLDVQQFLATCLRAKDSQCSNVYFIMEFPADNTKLQSIPSQNLYLIQKARASGFKIIKTNNQPQSISFIIHLIERIKQKLRKVSKGEQLWLQGNLQFFNQKNKKYLPIILKQVTKKILKCIPKIKRKTIQTILQKLPSLKALYNQLSLLTNHSQRIQLINWWLQSSGSKQAVNIMIIDLLFSESYDLPDEQII